MQSLRQTFVTRLIASAPNLNIKTLGELARHRNVSTTLKHYARAREQDMHDAVDSMEMPNLALGEESAQSEVGGI